MAVSESQKRSNRKWDAANMKVAACKLKKTEYAAFQAYAKSRGKTVSGALLDYVRGCISEDLEQQENIEQDRPSD